MNGIQRVIKYLAIAFAVCLIVSIFSSIIAVFEITGSVFVKEEKELKTKEVIKDASLSCLDVDLKATKLNIVTGDKLSVDTNNKYINVKESNNKLIIQEKNHVTFGSKNITLTITIPKNYYFDYINIDAGAGKIDIEELNARKLELDLGAGKVKINNLNVIREANIDGGAGKVDILSSNINNLDMDLGVGETIINSKLTGKNNLDCGVGRLELNLNGVLDNYSFEIEKGVGSIKLNKKELHNEQKLGTGANYIELNGGIGAVDITTK